MNYSRTHVPFTVCLAICLIGLSCQKENDPGIVVDFPKTFEVGIQEVFEGDSRVLKFQLQTLEVFECADAQIDLSLVQTIDLIELSVNEIVQPDTCSPEPQPATGLESIGQLEEGVWPVDIRLRQTISNQGQLVIQPGSIELQLFTEYGLVPGRTLLRRIPPQTIWGYIAYPAPLLAGAAEEVLTSIDSLSSRPAFFPPGYYSDFTVLPSGALQMPLPDKEKSYLLFLQRYEGSFENLQSLITPYLAAYDELDIRVFFHDGRVL